MKKIFHARETAQVHFQLTMVPVKLADGTSRPNPVLSRLDGKPILKTLPHQEMRLLCHFVEHPGELFTREQLQRVGWGPRRMHDDTVDRAISEIRAALGDNTTDQFFIQTVRNRYKPELRGYRFVAEFEPPSPDDGQSVEQQDVQPDPAQSRKKDQSQPSSAEPAEIDCEYDWYNRVGYKDPSELYPGVRVLYEEHALFPELDEPYYKRLARIRIPDRPFAVSPRGFVKIASSSREWIDPRNRRRRIYESVIHARPSDTEVEFSPGQPIGVDCIVDVLGSP